MRQTYSVIHELLGGGNLVPALVGQGGFIFHQAVVDATATR